MWRLSHDVAGADRATVPAHLLFSGGDGSGLYDGGVLSIAADSGPPDSEMPVEDLVRRAGSREELVRCQRSGVNNGAKRDISAEKTGHARGTTNGRSLCRVRMCNRRLRHTNHAR